MSDTTQSDVYRLLAEQLGDALIFATPDGKIAVWNRGAEALFGYSQAEASGQSLDLIIPERLRPAHWAGFDRAMARGAVEAGRRPLITRAQTRAGNAIYVEMSFAVVCDDGGRAIGAVAVAREATQRYLDDKALRARLATVEKLNTGSS